MGAPIVIYSRRECHLCDVAKAVVAPIAARRGLSVETFDVDGDPKLKELYGLEVPVVFVNGRKAFKYRVETAKLEALLDRGAGNEESP
jgi:glutaredoxin